MVTRLLVTIGYLAISPKSIMASYSSSVDQPQESFLLSSSSLATKKQKKMCEFCKLKVHPQSLSRHQKRFHSKEVQNRVQMSQKKKEQNNSLHLETAAQESKIEFGSTSFSDSSFSDSSDSESLELTFNKVSQRRVINMGLFDDCDALKQFKKIVDLETNRFRSSSRNIGIEKAAIMKTLRRLLFICVVCLKEINAPIPKDVSDLLFFSTSTSVIDHFVEELKKWSGNMNTVRNEVRRILFIQTYCLLYQTPPEDHSTVEYTRRCSEHIRRMLRFIRGQIKTLTKEQLIAHGRWHTIAELRQRVDIFFKEKVEIYLNSNRINKQFICNFEVFLFLRLLVFNRPARSQVYQDLCDDQITELPSQRLRISTGTFKTSKTFRLFQLTLEEESSKWLLLWQKKFRQYKSNVGAIFSRPVKDMARILGVSILLVRHFYRTEVSESALTEAEIQTLDSADCHLSTTASIHYVHPSIERRRVVSDEADTLYQNLFK